MVGYNANGRGGKASNYYMLCTIQLKTASPSWYLLPIRKCPKKNPRKILKEINITFIKQLPSTT